MELIVNPIDRFIIAIGQFITSRPRLASAILAAIVIFAFAGWLLASHYHRQVQITTMLNEVDSIPATSALPQPTTHPESINIPIEAGPWHTIVVKHNDYIERIFKRLHLSEKQLNEILALGEITHVLTKIKPQQDIKFLISADHQLQQMTYAIDNTTTLVITHTPNGFVAQHQIAGQNQPIVKPQQISALEKPMEVVKVNPASPELREPLEFASATIHKSLYKAGLSAGLSQKQAMQLVHIFGQSPASVKNIQPGEHLKVLYQQGKDGNIVLAQLTKKDKLYQAIRFTDPNGYTDYYDSDGISLHPPIVRAPLSFKRISSSFSVHRWQPILHFFRPHYGVDYSAVSGTPIKAAGDGRIVYRGSKGGYGNTILIKHSNGYETVYAHMSRYAKNIRTGLRVTQGEIIGYVGNTGLSTGPHLHYEIHLNRTPRNPLTMLLPNGTPLPKAFHNQFFASKGQLLAALDLKEQTHLAAETTKDGDDDS